MDEKQARVALGSVLIRSARSRRHACVASLSVLLIHSEIFWSLALAAAAMRLTSSALKRTGTIRPLASPFGNFGRPIFGLVCFAMFPEFLHDYCPDGGLRRNDGWDVKHRHVAFWVRWVICRVYPSVNLICFRVTRETEHFNNPIPYRSALEIFPHRDTLQMLSLCTMKVMNHAL